MDDHTTKQQIMLATYRALSKHGYAGLTMQNIADETDKSKSLLHYHYDTKQDLVTAFLDWLYRQLETELETVDGGTPRQELEELVDLLLLTDAEFRERAPFSQGEYDEFQRVLLQLKAQAAHDPAYRDSIRKFDDLLHGAVTDIVRRGVDSGDFRDVDPDDAATLLLAAVDGVLNREATLGGDEVERGRSAVKQYLVDVVLCGGPKH